jgi:hypothetical protein
MSSALHLATPNRSITPSRRGDPLTVAITIAIKNTGLWDAFEFKDAAGTLIRVARANLKTYGKHWRIHHGNTTYIIMYDNQAERVEAARKVQNYLRKNAQWNTMKLRPECALDYWQDEPSKLVVL